jgi:hypothetical protein
MKNITLALWALMACFLLTACNDKSKDEKENKGDYTQQVKDLDKDMAKNGDDWDVDEWEKALKEYVDITEKFIDSEPSDEELEKFNKAREGIKENFDNRNAKKAIKNLMDDDDFVKRTEKMDRKFTKMLQALYDKKSQEERNRDRDEDEEEMEEAEEEADVESYDDYNYADSTAVQYEQPAEPTPRADNKYDVACQRLLTEYDVQGLSKYELKVMRNWIFARHGYIFQSDDMKAFFASQPWYTPRYRDVTSYLSDIEIKNIDFIKRHE